MTDTTKKKYWRAAVVVDALAYVDIEADTEEEARELGLELVEPNNAELADPIRVVEVFEVTKKEFKGHGR